MTRELVYFEDFAPGRTWEWGEYTVTKEEIISFASMYDPQPFHVDEDAALASVFEGFTASSVHTIAVDKGPTTVAIRNPRQKEAR